MLGSAQMPQKKQVSFRPQLAEKQVVFQSYLDRSPKKRKSVTGLKDRSKLKTRRQHKIDQKKRARGPKKRVATQAICNRLGVDEAMTDVEFARKVNRWLLAQKVNFLEKNQSEFIKFTAWAAEDDPQKQKKGEKMLQNMHKQFIRLERVAQTCLSFRELPKMYMDDTYRFENIMRRNAKPQIKIKVPPQKPLQCRAKCKSTGKQCKNKVGRGCRKFCKTHSTTRGA